MTSSNYEDANTVDWAREAELDDMLDEYDTAVEDEFDLLEEAAQRFTKCPVCKGSGLVEVFDQETDCLECGGEGEFLIS